MKLSILPCLILVFNICIAQTNVEFVVSDMPRELTKKVGIRGSVFPLSWDKSLSMKQNENTYELALEFPDGTSEVEFKFVLFDEKEEVIWENSQNRVIRLKGKKHLTSQHQWNVEQIIDVETLPKLQPEQLLKDYELIKAMILEVHPGTYRYNDENTIQMALEELKEKFQYPMTYGEAYLAMSKVTAKLQCGHTQVGIFNQKNIINSIIHYQADKLPFAFTWLGDKMFVLHNASEAKALKRGTQILSINGVSVKEIQARMFPHIAADGATDNSRYAMMEVTGYDFEYYPFDVFYPLLFPSKTSQIQMEIKPYQNEKTQKVSVTPLTRKKRARILAERYPDFPKTRDEVWKFEITKDDIGILTLNSFALFGWKKLELNYKDFFADVFKQIKQQNIEHLIIDIRENNGGNDEIKIELFTYFDIDKNSLGFERVGKTRYLEFPENLKSHVQTWGDNPWYFNLDTPDAIDEENGYYIFEENMKNKFKKRKTDVFKGNLYLLTSPLNASLAFYLAADFKQKGLGKIIGQETGGNQRDINGGQILFLRLPNSEIEIDFPVMGGFSLAERPNKGIIPDLIVTPTLEDIFQGKDTILDYTLDLIRQ